MRTKPPLCRIGLHVWRPAAYRCGPEEGGFWSWRMLTRPRCAQCGRWKRRWKPGGVA